MRRLLLVSLALLLAACGFHPLYGGPGGKIRQLELSQISVTPIETTLGAQLRNALIDRLTPEGEPTYPQYRLDITLKETRQGIGIQSDASVTRWNYLLAADYSLLDLGNGKVLHSGATRTITAYNVADSQFATLSAEEDVKRRAAIDLSNEIELDLALFFEKHPG